MEFVYLVRDRLILNKRIIIFKHRDETEVSKILRKFKKMTFFSDVLCLSRPCVLNVCLAKAKITT